MDFGYQPVDSIELVATGAKLVDDDGFYSRYELWKQTIKSGIHINIITVTDCALLLIFYAKVVVSSNIACKYSHSRW